MKVSGERQFDAPVATVWEVLNDPAQMAKTMPGVESFDVADDRHWKAHVKIPLGLGGMRMSVSFEKTEEREPEFAKLHAKGDGVGAIMNMDTSFHLSDADAGGTTMRWEADVRIAGPVGSMGQRVLQPIVRRLVSRAIRADVTVEERASIPCLRHHGYASASQIVSIPASSMTRADASISSSGSIVSCMTPIRKGGGT